MARKHIARVEQRETEPSRSSESRGSLLSHPAETIRGLAERMEGFFEKPWDFFASALEPRLDLEQTPKELIVRARLPGYSREDIAVDLTEDSLTVRGRRSSTKESRRHGAYSQQSEETSFSRSLALPAEIRPEGAKASYKDGRLEIRLPRAKDARVTRVDVAE